MKHEHSTTHRTMRPYFGAVSRDENPMAHGGHTIREHCACGAQRDRNENGQQSEQGPWSVPAGWWVVLTRPRLSGDGSKVDLVTPERALWLGTPCSETQLADAKRYATDNGFLVFAFDARDMTMEDAWQQAWSEVVTMCKPGPWAGPPDDTDKLWPRASATQKAIITGHGLRVEPLPNEHLPWNQRSAPRSRRLLNALGEVVCVGSHEEMWAWLRAGKPARYAFVTKGDAIVCEVKS